MLGECTGRRDTQKSASVRGLGDLDGRLSLQAEYLHGPAGQAQAARCERQAGRRPGEQGVVQLLAQLRDVHRHPRVGHAQLPGRGVHRAHPDDSGERTKLGWRHTTEATARRLKRSLNPPLTPSDRAADTGATSPQ